MSVDPLVAAYQEDARAMREELVRRSRQLAEARRMLRMALEFGVTSVVDRGRLTEGCARDTRQAILDRLPKLDDRYGKRRRR